MSRQNKRARQRGRRALDYRAMMSLNGPVLHARAYRNADDAARDIEASQKDGADGAVMIYDLTCSAQLPTSRATSASGITLRLDNSNPDYPRESAAAFVTSHEKPFCTHVHRESGAVCLGDHWAEVKGKENLAELALRLFAAFNFEDPLASEPGFQPEAESYRVEVLGGRPFNPNIPWPVIPGDIYRACNGNEARLHVVVIAGAAPAPPADGLRLVAPAACRVVVLARGAS